MRARRRAASARQPPPAMQRCRRCSATPLSARGAVSQAPSCTESGRPNGSCRSNEFERYCHEASPPSSCAPQQNDSASSRILTALRKARSGDCCHSNFIQMYQHRDHGQASSYGGGSCALVAERPLLQQEQPQRRQRVGVEAAGHEASTRQPQHLHQARQRSLDDRAPRILHRMEGMHRSSGGRTQGVVAHKLQARSSARLGQQSLRQPTTRVQTHEHTCGFLQTALRGCMGW